MIEKYVINGYRIVTYTENDDDYIYDKIFSREENISPPPEHIEALMKEYNLDRCIVTRVYDFKFR